MSFQLLHSIENAVGNNVVYDWSLQEHTSNDRFQVIDGFKEFTVNGVDQSSLIIKESALDKGSNYKLVGSITTEGSGNGSSVYSFTTAVAPYGGTCNVNPIAGYALRTEFTVSCHGWNMNGREVGGPAIDDRLYFRIHLTSNKVTYGRDFFQSTDPVMDSLRLPSGPSETDHIWELLVEIVNEYKEFNTTKIAVQMLQDQPEEGSLELALDIIRAPDIVNDSYVNYKALAVVKAVSLTINMESNEEGNSVGSQKEMLRTEMCKVIESSASLLTHEESVYQISSAIEMVTRVPSQLTKNAQARDLTNTIVRSLTNLSSGVLRRMLPGEQPVNISTEGISMLLERTTMEGMAYKTIQLQSGRFSLPSPETMFGDDNYDTVDLKVVDYKRNPFTWDKTSNVRERVISVEIYDDNLNIIAQQNISEDFIFTIDYPKFPKTSTHTSSTEVPAVSTSDEITSVIAMFNVTSHASAVRMYISTSEYSTSTFMIDTKYGEVPEIDRFDFRMIVPGDTVINEEKILTSEGENSNTISNINTPARIIRQDENYEQIAPNTKTYEVFIPTQYPGTYYLQISEFNGLDKPEHSIINRPRQPFTLKIHTATCKYWNEHQERWTPDGCKWNTTALVGNRSGDHVQYHVTVYTGFTLASGTRSNIYFKLSGEKADSGIRLLKDVFGKLFTSGSINHFLLTVPKKLGELQYLYIWHDSSGLGDDASWFLNRIVVTDRQNGECFYFLCNQWLAVDKGDVEVAEEFLKIFQRRRILRYDKVREEKWSDAAILVSVLLLAYLFALMTRNPENTQELIRNETIAKDDDYENFDKVPLNTEEDSPYKPLTSDELKSIKIRRAREKQMMSVFYGIVVYVLFVGLSIILCRYVRDPMTYYSNTHLEDTFIKPHSKFNKIRTPDQFWDWLETVFVPNVYKTEKYLTTSSTDGRYFHIGSPRLRQQRHRKGPCVRLVQTEQFECELIGHLETLDFDVRWQSAKPDTNHSNTASPWKHQNSTTVIGIPAWGRYGYYDTNGYVATFPREISELRKLTQSLREEIWIDRFTSVALVEFDLYNPDSKLFASVTYMVEFLEPGGAECMSLQTSFRLLHSVFGENMSYDNYAITVFICWVLRFALGIGLFVSLVRMLSKQRLSFFKLTWNIFDLILVATTFASLTFMVVFEFTTSQIMTDIIKSGEGNLQQIAKMHNALNHILAVDVFLAILRFLKLLRFNRRMMLLSLTLRKAKGGLLSFAISYTIIICVFSHAAYLVFHTYSDSFKNVSKIASLLFTITVGGFPTINKRLDVSCQFSTLFLIVYAIFTLTITMNIFIAIINDAFYKSRAVNDKQKNHFDMLDYLMRRLRDKAIDMGLWTNENDMRKNEKDTTIDKHFAKINEKLDKIEDLMQNFHSI
ncbi:location of vulva defective 1-like [Glandiceps talaboti]